jgi:CRISPR-associated protein Cas2
MTASVRLYLVSYDISRPKHWRRVFNALKAVGRASQLSVFIVRLEPARMARLERELTGMIDPATDSLLIVDLGEAGFAADRLRSSGRTRLPAPPRPLII